jgi:competence ComEA-like helix-hairpin-helix protein
VRAPARIFVCATLLAMFTAASASGAGKGVEGTINLNTATAETLALLPGIGPSKAESILAYRKRHPFRTVDELVRIKGIGRKMVRRLRAHLATGGPTTASAASHVVPVAAPPAPPPRHPSPLPVCVRAPLRPARPSTRGAAPTHGACPRPP